jgi:hypothetical protein
MNTIINTGMETRLAGTPTAQPQLELALAAGPAARPRRQSRARWWFQRMRQVVEQACDWQPALTPRPEQTWFPNAYRMPSLAPLAPAPEQQICE